MKRLTIALIGAVALVAACSDDGPEDGIDASAAAGAGSGFEQSGMPSPETVEYFNVVVGDRVFFATDRHDLAPDAQQTLVKQAQWFNANPGTSAVVEGHADERGTREYNLALGARRANSVRDFLVGQGVNPARLRTVSYGKERPVALCSDESCWSQNRRAVTVVTGAPTG
ncbi:MAG TPA: peptidoglycan-associated lipoprotein Pal [Thermohalobaculum sp.]|nr:peptidoglycan-associated lipoprotein Pal [Thermohalobaculum sp.]